MNEEVNKLRDDIQKQITSNRYLEKELSVFKTFQDKFDDQAADLITLKQTNEEFRKDLA